MRVHSPLVAAVGMSISMLAGSPAIADEATPEVVAPAGTNTVHRTHAIIVRFTPDAAAADRFTAREAVDAKAFTSLGRRFQLLTLPPGADPDAVVAELQGNPDVADAARDGYGELFANEPNDALFDQLWGLDNKGLDIDGVSPSTPGADISALAAWGRTTGDNSVLVADLDDGIRPDHPDLTNRIWTNADEVAGNGIDDDANGYVDDTYGMDFAGADTGLAQPVFDNDPTDRIVQGGHGTHTAGTIAAEGDNATGITGVAQKATIMPIRVCGLKVATGAITCPFSSQIAGINYAGANGAVAASMSLGGYAPSHWSAMHWQQTLGRCT